MHWRLLFHCLLGEDCRGKNEGLSIRSLFKTVREFQNTAVALSPLFSMGSTYSLIEDKKSFSIVMPGTEDLATGSVTNGGEREV